MGTIYCRPLSWEPSIVAKPMDLAEQYNILGEQKA